jgi:tetratricopeptide (TPR) repeat protein
MTRLAHPRRLTILRDDHIGEALGAIFLDPSADKADWTIDLLRGYLGPRVRIVKVELQGDRAELDVEVRAFSREAEQLAAAAQDLRHKGGRRAAVELFREALELDPLSHTAAKGMGLALVELARYRDALAVLKRARETGPADADLLCGLGQAALRQDRTASAIVYLEHACELAPGHFAARRALAELGRKPKPPIRALTGPRSPGAGAYRVRS